MVAPAFGFSVGDFIAGTKIAIDILGAFKEAGGASSKYASEVMFLECLSATMKQIEEYFSKTFDVGARDTFTALLKLIDGPIMEFKIFLDNYHTSLSRNSTKSRFGKAPKIVTYTLRSLAGRVENLRVRICQPLLAINSALSLQGLKSLDSLAGPAPVAQTVAALISADVSAKLVSRISALQGSWTKHCSIQDRQRQDLLEKQIQDLQEAKKLFDDATVILQMTATSIQGRASTASDINRDPKSQVQVRDHGFPWETGTPQDHLRIDDGLGAEYFLPVELCETPEAFFELMKFKFQSRSLPGLPQLQKGHILVFEWDERHLVTHESWSQVVKGDRAIKMSFVMGNWRGPPKDRCMRCFKPRSGNNSGLLFKHW
ncbi:hypothetical protein EJ04DRAFT_358462 [Polyplosphaeria fusca]|uniref:Ubiquitin-like domain-containing protein n=1 Tax=Polyplosphaeria fusca TaxID=682080 RepID=A0A9P4QUQ1_9PLEO|nr:hypothetical protein EJ04DRAFT_358462 [Polyplosphaeria fusca]